jgi:hypothetical protein
MSLDVPAILKSFSSRFMSKAMSTFDRATVVVVGVCWGAAVLMMIFAIYAVMQSASTRRAADTAAASEPVLPKIVKKPADLSETKPFIDKIQRRYPAINFSIGADQSITISTSDGTKFHDFLNVLGYIDTVSPRFHWSIRELCIGKCGNALMRAVMGGEMITFEAPAVETK